MNNELVFVLEPDLGRVTVEISQASKQVVDDLGGDLGTRVNLNCARPAGSDRHLPVLRSKDTSGAPIGSTEFSIWLYGLYHNSVVDGPGRRSVVQVSGCSIQCIGCHVPQTHQRENGILTPIYTIVDEIIDRRDVHDGVTILGGEPFDQPSPVAELVSRLRRHGLHITLYSGYTLEELIGRKDPEIDFVLTHIDLLIDGPVLNQLAGDAGEYRGSRNQNLIGLRVK
jgi:anaerobic ribonucleoside-triphosphate reductase activating protein